MIKLTDKLTCIRCRRESLFGGGIIECKVTSQGNIKFNYGSYKTREVTYTFRYSKSAGVGDLP